MSEGPLSGRGIVVTRPREHALALAERIRAAGADPILFPTIEILPPENAAAVSSLIARLDGFQLAIFVSPTAAMRGHAMVAASRSWPEGLRAARRRPGSASRPLAERRNRSGLDYQRRRLGEFLRDAGPYRQGILARDPGVRAASADRACRSETRRAGDRSDRARRCTHRH